MHCHGISFAKKDKMNVGRFGVSLLSTVLMHETGLEGD